MFNAIRNALLVPTHNTHFTLFVLTKETKVFVTSRVQFSLLFSKRHIDTAFAVHPDFESHTGVMQHFVGGKGATKITSAKQKLNTSSSTTSGLVGVDQVPPLVLWTPLFVEAQGHRIDKNEVWQDNQSTVLLEKNRKTSSGKRTRASNTRHFVIADQVGRGNCAIKCCPTDDMIGDCMTKGLQGAKFATFRKKITGM